MKPAFCNLSDSESWINQASDMLTRVFSGLGFDSWPNIDSAHSEVLECIAKPNLCIGIYDNDRLLGWVGLRPMYNTTWEMHPLVVDTPYQHQGIGRMLVAELEKQAQSQGVTGIVLGSDDEHFKTSLSNTHLTPDNLFDQIQNIQNLNHHPFEFYQKLGYHIVGVIPDANGPNKPDILMWKSLT